MESLLTPIIPVIAPPKGSSALGLLEELRLPDGGMIRGTGRRCDISDGLMYIRATYTMRLRPVDTRVRMGEIRHGSRS